MTDAEWAAIRPLLPVPAWFQGRGGRPEGYCHRQLLDAVRYLVAGGISWRAMPADFPAWGRVYAFFRRWREHGLITEFHDRLRGKVREREGREAEPTAGIIDAQSVRAAATVPAASRGYDGGKKVPGRKRHIVTDTLGLLLVTRVTAANIGDRDAAAGLLGRLHRLHRDITLVWADGGYTGSLVGWCRDLEQFLPRDHPPVQLDLRGLQHLGQPRGFLPQALHSHPGSRLPLLQHPQHRRHRAPLDHEADTRRRETSLNPSETMPDLQESKDHVRLRCGF
ncbi:IS5 family transposase [Streptomyces sp. NPDC044984]|uniref:IS5 family transposase n=1 Tax=Streptomyces sp. NPDC044984 TaxID=3154335 RepID=UPI0033CD223C